MPGVKKVTMNAVDFNGYSTSFVLEVDHIERSVYVSRLLHQESCKN